MVFPREAPPGCGGPPTEACPSRVTGERHRGPCAQPEQAGPALHEVPASGEPAAHQEA